MTDEIEMPNEALENTEHAETSEHKKHEHAGKITLLILFLAMTAAVSGKISAETEIKYLTAEIELSDTWAQYQGKADRQAIAQGFARLATAMPNANDAGMQAAIADFTATAAHLDSDDKSEGKQQLAARAKTLEAERNRFAHRMEGFSVAVVLLALSIGLASASMLSRSKRASVTLATVAGCAGIGAALYGLLVGMDII